MKHKNPFEKLNKNPLDTTAINADPLSLGVEIEAVNVGTPFLDAIAKIKSILPEGAQFQLVPSGAKGIIIRQELSLELRNRIAELKAEIAPFKFLEFKTQDDVVNANATLSKTKKIRKALLEDRKVMSSPLDDEKNSLIRLEESIGNDLEADTKIVNDRIIAFQVKEQRKADEIAKKIEEEKRAELKRIAEEAARVSKIKQSIIDFESYALREIHSATIADIDDKIKRIGAVKLNSEHYEEFLGDAKIMYQSCVTKFNERKVELMRLSEAEKNNKELAEKLKVEQAEKAKLEEEQRLQREHNTKNEIEKQKQDEVSNAQMASEFKNSQITQAKGVVKRWGFDESKIDMALLPEEYKTYDAKKIKEAIAAGARDIPGVTIEQIIGNSSR